MAEWIWRKIRPSFVVRLAPMGAAIDAFAVAGIPIRDGATVARGPAAQMHLNVALLLATVFPAGQRALDAYLFALVGGRVCT